MRRESDVPMFATLTERVAIPSEVSRMLFRLLFATSVLALLTIAVDVQAQEESPLVKLVKSKVKDDKKPFAIIYEFKVKAGKEKEFEAAFVPFLEESRKEPGCVAFQLNRDTEHPEVYVVYEQFKSVAALEEHVKLPHAGKLLKTIRPLQDGAGKPTVYTVP